MSNIIRYGVIDAPKLPPYIVNSYNGTTYFCYNARFIRVVSEVLNVNYDIRSPEEWSFGQKEADGNWSGLLGLVARSEVDIVMYSMPISNEVPDNAHFSYPYDISDTTFMTNKPEPVPKQLAMFHPFSFSVWIPLVLSLVTLPFFFYVLMHRKVKYSSILLNVFGYLLEQSFNLQLRGSVRMFSTTWLFGAMIISYGYKAVLLSSLTIPGMSVIRDIPDLGRASAEGTVTCFTKIGSDIQEFTDSEKESWRNIGACLEKNLDNFKNNDDFYGLKSKKAFITSRISLSYDDNDYFLSDDSFDIELLGFAMSKKFCCPNKFNKLLNQLHASGLYLKFYAEQKFIWDIYMKSYRSEESPESADSHKISMSDVGGAFYILIFGLSFAFLVLIGEMCVHKMDVRKQ